MDWKDALKNMAGSLPEGDAPAAEAAEVAPASPKRCDRLSVSIERKGRGGKTATIIAGFTCSDDELRAIASRLKNRLATGGSARGGEILIQGDRQLQVKEFLREEGYKC